MARKVVEDIDRRLVKRRIRQGKMTRDQHLAHLAALPDRSDKVAPPEPEPEPEPEANADGDQAE